MTPLALCCCNSQTVASPGWHRMIFPRFKSKLQTSSSGQEGVSNRHEITLPSETTTATRETEHTGQCFQDIKHQAVKDSCPCKMETNEVSPTVVPPNCLERLFRHSVGRGHEAEPRELPELSIWETREIKAVRVLRTEHQGREHLHRERAPEICRGFPWVFSRAVSICVWWSYQSLCKEPSRGSEGTMPRTHTGSGKVPVATSQTRKPMIWEALSWLFIIIVPQSWGPTLNIVLTLPNKS